MANVFEPHHQDFLRILNKHEVEYLLIGGYAVNFYGYNRTTGDLDIWINKTEANKSKLVAAIEDFGYDVSQLALRSAEEILMFSLGSRNEPGHIEITNQIAGIQFEHAYKQVQVKKVGDIPVKFIHYKDLIKNKLASARHKDLDDVENLKNINREKYE